MRNFIKKIVSFFCHFLFLPFLGAAAVICAGIVYYNVSSKSIFFLAGWAVLALGLLIAAYRYRVCGIVLAGLELLLCIYFLLLTPQRTFARVTWQTPWAEKPFVEFKNNNDLAIVHNVRDFHYRSCDDYDVRYTSMTLDPKQVQTLDIALSHWDGLQPIAHTMLSFGFADGRHLAVSMETRLPVGAEQGFLPGMFKQYELLMILGTENDLFKLRTDHRKEDLYVYRTNATPALARAILYTVLHSANRLYERPRYYNSITRNCTTSLAPLLKVIKPGFEADIRLLLNGYSDELLYDLNFLDHREDETFDALKKRRNVNRYTGKDPDYSKAIRTEY